MRIKLDENISHRAVPYLRSRGHDVDTVPEEGFGGRPDDTVWEAAQQTQRFFIAQDLGFSDIRRFAPGTHHGILILRLGKTTRLKMVRRIRELFETEDVESWSRCLVVATMGKVRVRRPEAS